MRISFNACRRPRAASPGILSTAHPPLNIGDADSRVRARVRARSRCNGGTFAIRDSTAECAERDLIDSGGVHRLDLLDHRESGHAGLVGEVLRVAGDVAGQEVPEAEAGGEAGGDLLSRQGRTAEWTASSISMRPRRSVVRELAPTR